MSETQWNGYILASATAAGSGVARALLSTHDKLIAARACTHNGAHVV